MKVLPQKRAAIVHTGATWRAALTLALYRSAVAFGLVAMISIDVNAATHLFEPSITALFRPLCLVYLAGALGLAGTALVRRPRLNVHISAQLTVDIIVLVALSYAGRGAAGGLALLLLAPLAAGGMLLSARRAGLFAALSTLGLLGQELLRHWHGVDTRTNFVQSGILGALYFATTGAAFILARRVRASDASAANLASQARDLAEVNRRIVEHMQLGTLVVDRDDRVQTINQAALELIAHVPGHRRPERARDLPAALRTALYDWRFAHRFGETFEIDGRPIQPTFTALGNDDTTTLIFLEDVQRADQQAQHMKLISLGRLSGRIAHEIRNPLGAISHAEQLLAEDPTMSSDNSRLLAMIHRHCRRIDRIVNDVLGLARRPGQQPRTLTLDTWLDDAIADYRESRADPPRFYLETEPSALTIRFDPDQLRQVLFNLWDNADRHARRDTAPTIWIRNGRDDRGHTVMDILDNGPGIDADSIDRILEPFFTTAAEGTGLGLHIARELCRANGARLFPRHHAGTGACFRILLPWIPIEYDDSMTA